MLVEPSPMKNYSKQTLFVCAAMLVCALGYVWLSFGVYSDREFGGMHFFRKHQVSTRFYFYSPHGESVVLPPKLDWRAPAL
jgi:hypothetical protein